MSNLRKMTLDTYVNNFNRSERRTLEQPSTYFELALTTSTAGATEMTLKEIVTQFEKELQCNCNLDSWEPEHDTGHSWVCRIHKAAKSQEHIKELPE